MLSARAQRDLEKLPDGIASRIRVALKDLGDNPFHPSLSVRKLQGRKAAFRLRVGDYRVLYELDGDVREVFVRTIADRKDAY